MDEEDPPLPQNRPAGQDRIAENVPVPPYSSGGNTIFNGQPFRQRR